MTHDHHYQGIRVNPTKAVKAKKKAKSKKSKKKGGKR